MLGRPYSSSSKGHCLVMVFTESMMLSQFIKYSGYCKEHTATNFEKSAEYAKKEHHRLVHPDTKALKPVILKRK